MLLALDIGDYRRMNDIVTQINNNNIYTVSIDHHPENEIFFDMSLVDVKAPATGYLIWDYLNCKDVYNVVKANKTDTIPKFSSSPQ